MSDHEEIWKELRVRIDPSYHQKLVKLKMLRHKSMSDTIHEALDHYFADVLTAAPPPEEESDETEA